MKNYRRNIWILLIICIALLTITLYATRSWNLLTVALVIITSLTLSDTLVYYCYIIPRDKRKMREYNTRLNQLSEVYQELGFSKEAIEGIKGQMIREEARNFNGHKTEEKEHKDSL